MVLLNWMISCLLKILEHIFCSWQCSGLGLFPLRNYHEMIFSVHLRTFAFPLRIIIFYILLYWGLEYSLVWHPALSGLSSYLSLDNLPGKAQKINYCSSNHTSEARGEGGWEALRKGGLNIMPYFRRFCLILEITPC